MDGFQDLLGRLNGKSQEELGKTQISRETLKRHLYAERRFGTIRFVSGGLLIGDRMEEVKGEGDVKDSFLENFAHVTENVARPLLDQKPLEGKDLLSRSKRKSKKLRKGEGHKELTQFNEIKPDEGTGTTSLPRMALADDKAQRRTKKAQRKLQRKLRREARQAKKTQSSAKSPGPLSSSQVMPVDCEPARDIVVSSQLRSGIQTVRHRHIRQKKLAMTDGKALKEVRQCS